MTLWLDNMRMPARVRGTRGYWSHLTASTPNDLHEFAARLGLKRSWFQTCKRRRGREGEPCVHWHYDITDSKRAEAIALGAEDIDIRQMGTIISARRAALREGAEQ